MRQDDAGNHGVAELSNSTFFLAQTGELCGKSSGLFVENRNSVLDPIK